MPGIGVRGVSRSPPTPACFTAASSRRRRSRRDSISGCGRCFPSAWEASLRQENTISTEYVSELSENGIFVCTLNPRPVNAVFSVILMIHSIPVKLKAMVLRTVIMNRGLFEEPGMAMKFVEISPTDLELLRNFIKGQIMRDITAKKCEA